MPDARPPRPSLRAVGRQAAPSAVAGPGAVASETLLARVANGDEDSFAALYDRLAGPVFGLIRRVLRDPAQSEEVVQEVFLDIWRRAPRFDAARGSASTWVMTMAHRRAVDRVRSEQSARNRNDRVAIRDTQRAFDSVAEDVEIRMEHQRVRAALDELTPLQREAVELAYYGGKTYREVAELLDTPLGTVKTRLRDGLIRLRDTLGVTA